MQGILCGYGRKECDIQNQLKEDLVSEHISQREYGPVYGQQEKTDKRKQLLAAAVEVM